MSEDKIVAPVPVYNPEMDLVNRLIKELQEEKSKNYSLSKDLYFEKHKNQQLECYLSALTNSENLTHPIRKSEEKGKIKKIESNDTFASIGDLQDSKEQIGSYCSETRKEKIQRYKEKVKKYRLKVHVSRNFSGRSVVAKVKPRVNGKFVKSASVDNFNTL